MSSQAAAVALGIAGGAVVLWAGVKLLTAGSRKEERKVVRTPEERFANLPDYPFQPNYVTVDGMRMHYVDEGPRNGPVVLLLHGEPSWSYLYRKMIPPIVAAGMRVVAPDLIGFGKSDKPTRQSDYTYAGHIEWMKSFLSQLDLTDVTLFCQDWGALIGLRVVADDPKLFGRVVCGNGALPLGTGKYPIAFKLWKAFVRWTPWFPIGLCLQGGTVRTLSAEEVAAYEAPFPSAAFKAGAREFPQIVPDSPSNVECEAQKQAWEVLSSFNKPFLCTFSDKDPITRGADKFFKERIPGAKNLKHVTIQNAGHFLQEDAAEQLAQILIQVVIFDQK